MVDDESISADYFYTSDECTRFCEAADQEDEDIEYGTKLCCDYEDWTDGTYDCTLYETDKVIVNEYELDYEDVFYSFLFVSGEYLHYGDEDFEIYEAALRESMVEEGCDLECIDM